MEKEVKKEVKKTSESKKEKPKKTGLTIDVFEVS